MGCILAAGINNHDAVYVLKNAFNSFQQSLHISKCQSILLQYIYAYPSTFEYAPVTWYEEAAINEEYAPSKPPNALQQRQS